MKLHQNQHRSISALAALGGILMTLSMFFRLSYGPFGGEVSYFRVISGNLSLSSWPMLLIAWPVAFGMLEATLSLAQLSERATAAKRMLHAVAVGMLLLFVASVQLWLFARQPPSEEATRHVPLSLACAMGAVVGVGVVAIRQQPWRNRLPWLRIMATTWILITLFPVSSEVPVTDVFRIYGLGYWMLISGTLMVVASAVFQLYDASKLDPAVTEVITQPGENEVT